MTTPFKQKMSLDDLQKEIDAGKDGKAIMAKFGITNYTLQDKAFQLTKRENNMKYCIDIPAGVPSYEVKVTGTGRMSLPKYLLEFESVKPETKFNVVFEKDDILLRKVKPETKFVVVFEKDDILLRKVKPVTKSKKR